ncbi:3-phosphoshikimate 1-carboxyvinyltransferase, partial [mine drainage metagenome]
HGHRQRPGQIAILLAGLYADGVTRVDEAQPTRDYTERMLQAFGWPIEFGPGWAALPGRQSLRGDVQVPGDFSSAAFFIVAATLVPAANCCCRRSASTPAASD